MTFREVYIYMGASDCPADAENAAYFAIMAMYERLGFTEFWDKLTDKEKDVYFQDVVKAISGK